MGPSIEICERLDIFTSLEASKKCSAMTPAVEWPIKDDDK